MRHDGPGGRSADRNDCPILGSPRITPDPEHSDTYVDKIVVAASRRFPAVIGAMEGMELDLSKAAAEVTFQTSFDKRYATRYDLSLPLRVRDRDLPASHADLQAQNISLDGAYVTSSQPLEIGQEPDIELQFAAAQVMQCKARVTRCEKLGDEYGIGRSFRR